MDKKEKNEKVEKVEKVENTEKNVKVEKNDKKNYSIIIAIALIAILIVAMICIGCSKKNNELPSGNDGTSAGTEVNSGEEESELPKYEDMMFPEFEKNVERDEEGNKVNVSPNIKEKMTFDFLDLTGISLTYANGTTNFNAKVMNNSDKDYLLGLELKITFYDNDGHEIYETHILTSALYANKESLLQARFTMDCSYADTFDIEIIEHDM